MISWKIPDELSYWSKYREWRRARLDAFASCTVYCLVMSHSDVAACNLELEWDRMHSGS